MDGKHSYTDNRPLSVGPVLWGTSVVWTGCSTQSPDQDSFRLTYRWVSRTGCPRVSGWKECIKGVIRSDREGTREEGRIISRVAVSVDGESVVSTRTGGLPERVYEGRRLSHSFDRRLRPRTTLPLIVWEFWPCLVIQRSRWGRTGHILRGDVEGPSLGNVLRFLPSNNGRFTDSRKNVVPV